MLRFPRLADFFDPATHVRRVSVIALCDCPTLTKPVAVRIAQEIIKLCRAEVDPEEERDETRGWLQSFISGLGTISPGELLEPGPDRWDALVAAADYRPDIGTREIAASTAAIGDSEGRLWIPADRLMRHVRYVERAQIDWGGLTARMAELGWERRKFEMYEPGRYADRRRGARRIRMSFYVESDPPTPTDPQFTRARAGDPASVHHAHDRGSAGVWGSAKAES